MKIFTTNDNTNVTGVDGAIDFIREKCGDEIASYMSACVNLLDDLVSISELEGEKGIDLMQALLGTIEEYKYDLV
jgi:hypothetical protein